MREFKLSNSLLSQDQYEEMYVESFKNREQFWSKIAKSQLSWFKDFTKIKNTNFDGDVSIKWFEDGDLNVCFITPLQKRRLRELLRLQRNIIQTIQIKKEYLEWLT